MGNSIVRDTELEETVGVLSFINFVKTNDYSSIKMSGYPVKDLLHLEYLQTV